MMRPCPPRKTYALRRPQAKYAIGTTPSELISVTAAAHLALEPRTSLAGRRTRSIRAATLSRPSMRLAKTISRRVRGERSFHFFLFTTSTLTGMFVACPHCDRGGEAERRHPGRGRRREWPRRLRQSGNVTSARQPGSANGSSLGARGARGRRGLSLEHKHRRDSREPRRLDGDGRLDFVVQSDVALYGKVQSEGER